MKNISLLLLITLIFSGCALRGPVGPVSDSKDAEITSGKSGKTTVKTKAIFHVIAPLGIELLLYNLDHKLEERLIVDKTLSEIGLQEGHWLVSGFVLNGKRYKVLNSSQRFIFRLKSKEATYAGSYIFQCPKVGQEHVSELKKMNFFNRYPFSSDQRLCEMVVGSAYKNVNRAWLHMSKDKKPLDLGF